MVFLNRGGILASPWFMYALSVLFICFILFVPGFLASSFVTSDRINRASFAPFVSVFLLFCVGTVAYLLSIQASWWQLLVAVFAIAVLILLVSGRLAQNRGCNETGCDLFVNYKIAVSFDCLMLAMYILLGCTVTLIFFVKTLDGPNSFITLYDNAFHLSLIRSFSNAGFFTPLGAILGLNAGAATSGLSFYPAMLHVLSALAVDALNVSPALAMNSVLTVFIGFVFPAGCFSLIRKVSRGDRITCFCGAFIVLAFGAFPWRFFQWGPLYPNAISYAMIPGFLNCFICALETNKKGLANIIAVVVGIMAMAVTQTNADFTAAVILVPFVVYKLHVYCASKSRKAAVACLLGFPAFVIVFWLVLYRMPFLSAVVNYTWAPVSSTSQAILNVMNLSFTGGMAQPLLALLVIIGLVVVLVKKPECRWMAASYCLLVLIYLASSSATGVIQHILSGFWYTDSNRTAASVVMVAIPFASFGLAEVAGRVAVYAKQAQSKCIELGLAAATVLVITGLVFLPNYYISGFADVTTSFGATGDYLTRLNMLSAGFSLSKDELAFADEVHNITGSDAIVLNNPFDGSVFLYSSDNINMYFKSFIAFGGNDTAGSINERNLRRDASCYMSNSEIYQLMKEYDIEYVIQLDSGGLGSSNSTFDNNYSDRIETYFKGIQSIDESTPGFSLVLSSGDMRLYKVDY